MMTPEQSMTKEEMTMDFNAWRTGGILGEIADERARQWERWGDQTLPAHDGQDPSGSVMFGRTYADLARAFKSLNDNRQTLFMEGGHRDYRSDTAVLLEEVFESLAETDPAKMRAELVQVAAVAVKMIELIDRRAEGDIE
jgi:hypothetical protein